MWNNGLLSVHRFWSSRLLRLYLGFRISLSTSHYLSNHFWIYFRNINSFSILFLHFHELFKHWGNICLGWHLFICFTLLLFNYFFLGDLVWYHIIYLWVNRRKWLRFLIYRLRLRLNYFFCKHRLCLSFNDSWFICQ